MAKAQIDLMGVGGGMKMKVLTVVGGGTDTATGTHTYSEFTDIKSVSLACNFPSWAFIDDSNVFHQFYSNANLQVSGISGNQVTFTNGYNTSTYTVNMVIVGY